MAESALSIDYSDITQEVGHFLGWNRTESNFTTDNNTDLVDIIKRGSRSFYWPVLTTDEPYYEWSFLRQEGTITLVTNDADYDLPDDFSSILDQSVTYAANQDKKPLLKVAEHIIRANLTEDNDTGVSEYYAIRHKTHAPTTGHRFEFLPYPVPSSTENDLVLTYRYVFQPGVITSSNKYPAGGGRHSETFLAAIMAAAEDKIDDDPNGPMKEKFRQLLTSSVREDMTFKENDRGGSA